MARTMPETTRRATITIPARLGKPPMLHLGELVRIGDADRHLEQMQRHGRLPAALTASCATACRATSSHSPTADRKSVVSGKRVHVLLDLGVLRLIIHKNKNKI